MGFCPSVCETSWGLEVDGDDMMVNGFWVPNQGRYVYDPIRNGVNLNLTLKRGDLYACYGFSVLLVLGRDEGVSLGLKFKPYLEAAVVMYELCTMISS